MMFVIKVCYFNRRHDCFYLLDSFFCCWKERVREKERISSFVVYDMISILLDSFDIFLVFFSIFK